MEKPEKLTIKTISEATGYSVSTVSRVLNGLGANYRISKEAQQLIQEKAASLNFSPNLVARSLRLSKTSTIGLILPNIANPFFAEIAKVITRKARSVGQSILLLDSEESPEVQKKCIQTLLARHTDGIIVFPTNSKDAYLEGLYKEGTPLVLVDRYLYNSNIPYVSSNNLLGAFEATNYLIAQGHKHIACLQGNTDSSPSKERVKGYTKAMKEHALSEKHSTVVGTEFSEESGYEETKKIIASRFKTKITALFALSNLIAIGAIQAIREANLSIPEDLSLITFDDHKLLSMLSPSITAVAQPTTAIGEMALEKLLDQIDNNPKSAKSIQLPTSLVVRNSVKKIKR